MVIGGTLVITSDGGGELAAGFGRFGTASAPPREEPAELTLTGAGRFRHDARNTLALHTLLPLMLPTRHHKLPPSQNTTVATTDHDGR